VPIVEARSLRCDRLPSRACSAGPQLEATAAAYADGSAPAASVQGPRLSSSSSSSHCGPASLPLRRSEWRVTLTEQTVGVHKEVTSAVFRVRDFAYICTPGEKAGCGHEAQDLEKNSVSSGAILQAGEYSFKVIVAWSLGHDGSITEYSMLGIAVQRVGGGDEPVVMQLELRLVNRDPCQDIAMRSNIQPLRNTLGWYPSPYAMGREQADGFIPLRSVLDPSNGWLVDDTLTVECKMTVSLSRVTPLPCQKATFLRMGAQSGQGAHQRPQHHLSGAVSGVRGHVVYIDAGAGE